MSGVVCTCIWRTIPSHLISESAEHWLLMLLLGQHQSSDEPDWLVFWQSAVHWWSRLHGSCCKCLRQCFCCCLYCFVPFLTGKDKVCHTLSAAQAWCSSPFLRPWDHWSINGILWCMAMQCYQILGNLPRHQTSLSFDWYQCLWTVNIPLHVNNLPKFSTWRLNGRKSNLLCRTHWGQAVCYWEEGREKVWEKRNVLSLDVNTVTESLLTIVFGSEFQTAGAEHQ